MMCAASMKLCQNLNVADWALQLLQCFSHFRRVQGVDDLRARISVFGSEGDMKVFEGLLCRTINPRETLLLRPRLCRFQVDM